jgi:tetratricopeptide (TPR) repeat protein
MPPGPVSVTRRTSGACRSAAKSSTQPIISALISKLRKALGDAHAETLEAQYELASLYTMQGRSADAERLYLSTIEAQRRLLGEQHPSTLRTMGNLASLYFRDHRYVDAEPLNRKVYENTRHVQGDDHTDTLIAMYNLATVVDRLQRYDEAEPLLRHALADTRRLTGGCLQKPVGEGAHTDVKEKQHHGPDNKKLDQPKPKYARWRSKHKYDG